MALFIDGPTEFYFHTDEPLYTDMLRQFINREALKSGSNLRGNFWTNAYLETRDDQRSNPQKSGFIEKNSDG